MILLILLGPIMLRSSLRENGLYRDKLLPEAKKRYIEKKKSTLSEALILMKYREKNPDSHAASLPLISNAACSLE